MWQEAQGQECIPGIHIVLHEVQENQELWRSPCRNARVCSPMEKAKENLNNERPNLTPIRCSVCSRFLGYELIYQGMVFPFCPNCKNFTQVITEGFDSPLTLQEINAILTSRRTKGQKGH